MGLARRIVSLGHQARNQAQVKVRQPLARVIVSAGDDAHLASDVVTLIDTELNVERVELVEDLSGYFDEVPSPNFRTLGPRLGPLANRVAEWIKAQSAESIRDLLSGGGRVSLDGDEVVILADDVIFEAQLPERFVLVEEGGTRLLLDTRIDDRLREMGLVREISHRIQVLRKEADFEVTDRIVLSYEADAEMERVMKGNRDEIASEVLATSIEDGISGDQEIVKQFDIDGALLKVGLRRSAAKEG